MPRGWNRPVAPGQGVAKGEYHIPIFWSSSSFSTTSTSFQMVAQAVKFYWVPANWPSAMNWYLEVLINGTGASFCQVALYQYSSGTLGATSYGSVTNGGFLYTPEVVRSGALTMPTSSTTLTIAYRSDNGGTVYINGARLVGIPV